MRRTATTDTSRWTTWRRALGAVAAGILAVGSLAGAGQGSGLGGGDGSVRSGPVAIPSVRQADNVAIVTIDGPIDTTMARSVMRRITEAEEAGADALVIEIDSPGGEVGAVLDITSAIKSSSIKNTVAWINTQAYSGGAISALACREIVTSSSAAMGDAFLILASGNPFTGGIVPLPEVERQKMSAPILVDVVDSARRNGYDEKLVQGMILPGVELWYVENIETGERLFIDRDDHLVLFGLPPANEAVEIFSAPSLDVSGVAPDPVELEGTVPSGGETGAGDDAGGGTEFIPARSDLDPSVVKELNETLRDIGVTTSRPTFAAGDGSKWRKVGQKLKDAPNPVTLTTDQMLKFGVATQTIDNDRELKAYFGAKNLSRLNRSWSERLVVFMSSFIVRGLLLVVILIGLFVEFTQPGSAIGGGAAAVVLVLFLAPPLLTNMATWWEVAAIGLGIGFIAMEILVLPGFGVFGITGMVLLFGGIVATFVGGAGGMFPGSPTPQSELVGGLITVILSTVIAGTGIYFLARNLTTIPVLNRFILTNARDEESSTDGLLASMVSSDGSRLRVGDVGRSVTSLRPVGRAMFNDEVFDVTAELNFIDDDTSVRIVSIDTFRTVVERATPEQDAGGSA